jgi:hypothetical protein
VNWLTGSISGKGMNLDEVCYEYGRMIHNALEIAFFSASVAERYTEISNYISSEALKTIKAISRISGSLEILRLIEDKKYNTEEAMIVLNSIKQNLGISGREYLKDSLLPTNRWEYTLRKQSLIDIDKALVRMVDFYLSTGKKEPSSITSHITQSTSFEPVTQSINELTNLTPSIAHFAVIARQLSDFVLR